MITLIIYSIVAAAKTIAICGSSHGGPSHVSSRQVAAVKPECLTSAQLLRRSCGLLSDRPVALIVKYFPVTIGLVMT
eukprot:4868285-Heterocapsa_arctica.AAC.1